MARERSFDAQRLNVPAFAAAAGRLRGECPQASLQRMCASLMAMPGDSLPPPVSWVAAGELRPKAGGTPETWLHLQARATVTLQCQRCLQPMSEPAEIDRWFRFVGSEDEAEREDEDSEEDVLVASRHFDLLELLEDELILALPLVPRHETCPQPLPMSAGDDTIDEAEAENPFAALAALRGPRGGG
jgi:uncharacterized protein